MASMPPNHFTLPMSGHSRNRCHRLPSLLRRFRWNLSCIHHWSVLYDTSFDDAHRFFSEHSVDFMALVATDASPDFVPVDSSVSCWDRATASLFTAAARRILRKLTTPLSSPARRRSAKSSTGRWSARVKNFTKTSSWSTKIVGCSI